ncbi:MAG: cupin domain-containing protein [Gaiellaceae bacterium]
MPEAPLRSTKFGLVADVDGWFVVNTRQARWRDYGPLGVGCNFEGKRAFRQLGVNVNVLRPGEPLGLYHREARQEGFLVLTGECVLIVEGKTRRLRAWDFFHCPAGTAHIVVGAGDGASVVVAVGARLRRKGLEYVADPLALAHGAGVEEETRDSRQAYARFPAPQRTRYGDGWLPDF